MTNLETCRNEKENTTVIAIEVTQQSQKPQKISSYACHICGLNGHKMTDCPKFIEMQKMFCGKYVTIVEIQPVAKRQIVIIFVNVVDVNVTTRSKAIEEQVFKDRELRKTKNAVHWERKKWLKKSMVETIQ